MSVLGVDPGVRGGLAVLSDTGFPIHARGFNPSMTQKELVECVEKAVAIMVENGGYECFCEKVGYRPTDGGKGANTFGRVDGLLRGAVLAFHITLHDVAPMIWQGKLNCLSGGNKNVTKNKALEIFGGRGIKITHATADALLIAEFGRLTVISRGRL